MRDSLADVIARHVRDPKSTFSAIATDLNRGVTDRFRSLPMARSALRFAVLWVGVYLGLLSRNPQLLLVAVFFPLSVRQYRRLSR